MTYYAWCCDSDMEIHYANTIPLCLKEARKRGLKEIYIAPVEEEYIPDLFENVDVLLEYVLRRDNKIPKNQKIELDITKEEYDLLRSSLNSVFREWIYQCKIEFNKDITDWKLYKVNNIHIVKGEE